MVHHIVEQDLDLVLLPDEREHVELIGKRGREFERWCDDTVVLSLRIVGAPVAGAVHQTRLVSHELHDVDFTASGPTDLVDVRTEHPQGRPDALSDGQYGADVDPAVLKVKDALGLEPR